MKQLPVRYGPKKIGQEEFERQQAMKQFEGRQGTVYGKRKGDGADPSKVVLKHSNPESGRSRKNAPKESARDEPQGNPFVDEKGSVVTISDMGEILEGKPGLLDVAIETELAQPSPRKGAVELLQKTENARPSGARESVLELLGKLA